jgi:hypothetical protein
MKPLALRLRQPALWLLVYLFVFLFLPIASNWLGDSVAEVIPPPLRSLFAVILLLAGFFIAVAFGKKLISPTLKTLPTQQPREVLIAFLSDDGNTNWTWTDGKVVYQSGNSPPVCVESIETWAQSQERLGSWQQIARAVCIHLTGNGPHRLRKLILIGSRDRNNRGSVQKLPQAVEIFKHLLAPHGVVVEAFAGNAPDFEELEDVTRALQRAYEQAGAKPGQIVIDVTGGQKTASVAAAMFTLDKRDLVFQYVSTTPPYETKTFYAETATLQFG